MAARRSALSPHLQTNRRRGKCCIVLLKLFRKTTPYLGSALQQEVSLCVEWTALQWFCQQAASSQTTLLVHHQLVYSNNICDCLYIWHSEQWWWHKLKHANAHASWALPVLLGSHVLLGKRYLTAHGGASSVYLVKPPTTFNSITWACISVDYTCSHTGMLPGLCLLMRMVTLTRHPSISARRLIPLNNLYNLDTMGMTFQDFFHPPPVGKEVSVLVCGLVV